MIKHYFVDGLVQLAIVLSLLRTDVNDYFNRSYINYPEVQEIVLGQSLGYTQTSFHDLLNGFDRFSTYQKNIINEDDVSRTLYQFRQFVQPRSLSTNINAFLADFETQPVLPFLNNSLTLPVIENNEVVDDNANDSGVEDDAVFLASETAEAAAQSELSKEDMELIDALWRQDIDLGIGREFFDVNLRQELERERELELRKQRYREYELELLTYKKDEERGQDAQQWLSHNFYQDGETGEYIPLTESNPYSLVASTHTCEPDTHQEFTFEEAFEILDRVTSSVPPQEPSFDDSSPPDLSPNASLFSPNASSNSSFPYPGVPPYNPNSTALNVTFTQNYGPSMAPVYTPEMGFPSDNFTPFSHGHLPPVSDMNFPPIASDNMSTMSQQPMYQAIPQHNYHAQPDPAILYPQTLPPPYDEAVNTSTQFMNPLYNQTLYQYPQTFAQTIDQSACPVFSSSQITNQSFLETPPVCEIDHFDDINTDTVNITGVNLDHVNIERLSSLTETTSPTHTSPTHTPPTATHLSDPRTLHSQWDDILLSLELPDPPASNATPGLIRNTSMSTAAGAYYDNTTAALTSASDLLEEITDVGIADCFKFFNGLSSDGNASEYLTQLDVGGGDGMQAIDIMDINFDEELDCVGGVDDMSNDSAVSLSSRSPSSHTTELMDLRTLSNDSPYDGIIGATGGSDYSSTRKRLKSESSDFSDAYSLYECDQATHDSNSSSTNSSSYRRDHTLDARSLNHNHTYPLQPGVEPRPKMRPKKKKLGCGDTPRIEGKLKNQLPFSMHAIVSSSVDEFNEMIARHKLSRSQVQTMRDVRRRGKNKVAAQNCRKRKINEIFGLGGELGDLQEHEAQLRRERDKLGREARELRASYDRLYEEVFQSLRNESGNAYDREAYSLQETADGELVLVPRNASEGRPPPSDDGARRQKRER